MSKVRLYGDTSGYVDLKAPDVAGDVTITLPNTTGPFATETYVDSLLASAGELVAVKSALLSSTQVESSIAAGASFDISGLSITHEVENASNRLIFFATIMAAHSVGFPLVGISFAANGTPIGIGDAAGSRQSIGSSGVFAASGSTVVAGTIPALAVYTPGSGSKTYTVQARNLRAISGNIYINRTEEDSDAIGRWRGASTFLLAEVKA